MEAVSPAELDACTAPLEEQDRRRLQDYWDQVIREEWVPPSRRPRRPVPVAGLDGRRERREAQRSLGAVARLALRRGGVARGGSGGGGMTVDEVFAELERLHEERCKMRPVAVRTPSSAAEYAASFEAEATVWDSLSMASDLLSLPTAAARLLIRSAVAAESCAWDRAAFWRESARLRSAELRRKERSSGVAA